MTTIRVLIVDDHRVFADALQSRLSVEPDLAVVGTAATVESAITAVDLRHPDVTIVDLELGGDDGIGLIERLRARDPGTHVVVVTAQDDWQAAVEAVRAGASAFVAKGAPMEELVEALRGVVVGHSHIPPPLLTVVLQALQETSESRGVWRERLQHLTPRELEVLELMVAGLDRSTIAERLYVSLNTVRTHTKNILAKLGVHSSLEAVSIALRAGMRPPQQEVSH